MPMLCLADIVGVSNSDCECILTGLEAGEITAIRKSTSGLYLDDLPGGVHMKALKHADACRNLKEMGLAAIVNAGKVLEDDLIVALNNKYSKSKKTFYGSIGRKDYAATLTVPGRWAGIRIKPWDYSDAVIVLNKVNFIRGLPAGGVVSFFVYLYRVPVDSVMGTLVTAFVINSTLNAWVSHVPTVPLKLPFIYDDQAVEYWFVYDRNDTASLLHPKDNSLECASCVSRENRLDQFAHFSGVQFEDINALNIHSADSYARGLSLDVVIKCDNETLFCREYNAEDAVAVTMSRAVWFKAGEFLIEDVLKQPDVNRYTTMAREYLWGKRNHFRAEYDARISYLAQVVDVAGSNCYICRETAGQPFKAGIFK